MFSCYGGHFEIVVQLINAGAMVNRMSKVMLRNNGIWSEIWSKLMLEEG